MFEFINPLSVWLALAAAIPLIIHLLNRRRFQPVPWAAMDFLLKAFRKNRRRLRVESLLLLLLRMLIIVVLAFILARPYFKGSMISKEPDTHFIIAVDNSYSMGYRNGMFTLFDEARNITGELIDLLKPERGDKLSLLTISAHPEVLINESSYQKDQAKSKIANLQLSNYYTDITQTMVLARDIFNKSTSSRKILYLVTDNQRVMWDKVNALQDKSIFGDMPVRIIQVGSLNADNRLIKGVYSDQDIVTVGSPVVFYAELGRYSDTDDLVRTVTVNFFVQNQKFGSTLVELLRNSSTVVPFTHYFNQPGQYWVKIEIDGDNLSVDDSRFYAVDVKDGIRILIISGQSDLESSGAGDETIFLRYAFNPSLNLSGDSFSPYRIDKISVLRFMNTGETDLLPYSLIIISNVEFIPREKIGFLEDFVMRGGGVLIFLGERVNQSFYNEFLYQGGASLLPFPLTQVRGDMAQVQAFRFGFVDFSHPAMNFFYEVRDRFNTLPIFRYYGLNESAPVLTPSQKLHPVTPTVLARLNLADQPAIIVEKSLGKGSVIVIGTSADTQWNLMPARPMYVMLLDRLVLYLSAFREKSINRNIIVGSPIDLTRESNSAGGAIRLPSKELVSLAPMTVSPSFNAVNSILFYDTKERGIYTLLSSGQEFFFAANSDASEGDLRKMTTEQLRGLVAFQGRGYGDASAVEIISPEDALVGIDSESQRSGNSIWGSSSPLWRYLMYILLVSVVMEMFLAWYFGKR